MRAIMVRNGNIDHMSGITTNGLWSVRWKWEMKNSGSGVLGGSDDCAEVLVWALHRKAQKIVRCAFVSENGAHHQSTR